MDSARIPIHDFRNANMFQYTSFISMSPPPLKRMRQSFSSSLDMNENSSMEYDSNVDYECSEYKTDQSLEYQTEASAPSQDMMTCSSACNSSVYPRSNPDIGISVTETRPAVPKDEDCGRTPIRRKRRLLNVGSNTFSSCSTNVSQSSTLTEISLMDDENIVVIDDVEQSLPSPEYCTLYNKEVDRQSVNETNDSMSEMDDTMMITDSSLSFHWDQSIVLHAPAMHHTNRRTKEQVQQAKGSTHRLHFQT